MNKYEKLGPVANMFLYSGLEFFSFCEWPVLTILSKTSRRQVKILFQSFQGGMLLTIFAFFVTLFILSYSKIRIKTIQPYCKYRTSKSNLIFALLWLLQSQVSHDFDLLVTEIKQVDIISFCSLETEGSLPVKGRGTKSSVFVSLVLPLTSEEIFLHYLFHC